MKRYTFDGSKHASILCFLQVFKRQCHNHTFSEGETFLALLYFLTDHDSDAFNASCKFGDKTFDGITNYCQAMNFLLRLFTKNSYLDDAMDKFDAICQRPDEDEVAYSHRLHDAAYDFGPVFVERDLVTRFINSLTDTLKPMQRAQQFRPGRNESFYDFEERAASIGDSFRAIRRQEKERKPLFKPHSTQLKRAGVQLIELMVKHKFLRDYQTGDQVNLVTQTSPASSRHFTLAESLDSALGPDSEQSEYQDTVLAAYAGAAYNGSSRFTLRTSPVTIARLLCLRE